MSETLLTVYIRRYDKNMSKMTFWITKDNEQKLKYYGSSKNESMGGLVNQLLGQHFIEDVLQPNFSNKTQDRVNTMVLKKETLGYNDSRNFHNANYEELTIEPLDQ